MNEWMNIILLSVYKVKNRTGIVNQDMIKIRYAIYTFKNSNYKN